MTVRVFQLADEFEGMGRDQRGVLDKPERTATRPWNPSGPATNDQNPVNDLGVPATRGHTRKPRRPGDR